MNARIVQGNNLKNSSIAVFYYVLLGYDKDLYNNVLICTAMLKKIKLTVGVYMADVYARCNIYNICANCYPSFGKVAEDFTRIKAMGFDTIWFLPILEPGLDTAVKRKIEGGDPSEEFWMRGSLYAATYKSYEVAKGEKCYYLLNLSDPKTPFSSMVDGVAKNNEAIDQVQKMILTAKDAKLTPIFDLVMNHVSIDSPLRHGDMAKFFCEKPHKKFNDVVGFNYDTLSQEIFEKLWEPVIDWFINTLGFEGVRIDALAWVHPNILDLAIKSIETKFKYKGIKKPIIFGELYGEMFGASSILESPSVKHLIKKRRAGNPLPFSHFMNTANEFNPLSIPFCDDKGFPVAFSKEVVIKRRLLPETAGGTIGAPGTHDRLSLKAKCEAVNNSTSITEIIRMMKEKILEAVIGSDGGWFLMGGDEFGVSLIHQPPFLYKSDIAVASSLEYLTEKGLLDSMQYRYQDCQPPSQLKGSQYDLSEFITAVNVLSSKIKYETLTPICKFIQYMKDGKLLFMAIGNFVKQHYIAIDLSDKSSEGLRYYSFSSISDMAEECAIKLKYVEYRNWVINPIIYILKNIDPCQQEGGESPAWPGSVLPYKYKEQDKTNVPEAPPDTSNASLQQLPSLRLK